MSGMAFSKIGGSFQFLVEKPDDLRNVLTLDPALWAALSAPVGSLNGDPKFFSYLDVDKNGFIRIDDIYNAIRMLIKYFSSLDVLSDATSELELSAIDAKGEDGAKIVAFVETFAAELTVDGKIILGKVTAKISGLAAGALTGDGIVCPAAVTEPDALLLFNAIVRLSGGVKNSTGVVGINAAQLEKFISDGKAFLEWAKETKCPLFRGVDPVAFYEPYNELKGKIDEFFSFCELLQLDEANAMRFRQKPEALTPLDIYNHAAVSAALTAAPLAAPHPECVWYPERVGNPFYRRQQAAFVAAFGAKPLSSDDWVAIKNDFAAYEEYLNKASGDNVGSMGTGKLENIFSGNAPDMLRNLFAADNQLGALQQNLKILECLILYKQHFLELVRNFVNFEALFLPEKNSLLQAGKVIMDGRTFRLTLRINSPADHKKIAVRSNLCMIYLELLNTEVPGGKFFVVAAVTNGDLLRIYSGKPAVFVDVNGKYYSGTVVDVVPGPISFAQALWAPFRNLGDAITDKLQKVTDFSGVEKKLENTINTGKLPATPVAPPVAGAAKGLWNNGSMLLLAGGLSVAAIGAAAGFVVRSVLGMMATISAMSWWSLGSWLVVVAGVIFVPLSINAFLRLRRRNLTLFIEAAGWAVNLPMRLSGELSRVFSSPGRCPEDSVVKRRGIQLPFPVLPVRSVNCNAATGMLLLGILFLLLIMLYWHFKWCK